MKNGWRVVLIIVLVAILLGGICLGVGLMTGAETERIYTVLDKQYNLTGLYKWVTVDIPTAFKEAGILG